MMRMRCATPVNAAALSATSDVSVASNARISIVSFGATPPIRSPLRNAPSPRRAVHSSPVPKSWTYAKWTSRIVSPSATAIDSEKNGMPRFAFSEPSIGSTTTRVLPLPRMPASSLTIVTSSPSKCASTTSSAAASTAVVSSPPSPRASTGSRSTRVGSCASTPSTSRAAARQSSSQSVKGIEQQAGGQLGEEVRRLLRHHLAAPCTLEHGVDRRRADEERALGLAAVDGRLGVLAARGVAGDLGAGALDDLDVEPVAFEQHVAPARVEHDAGQLVARPLDFRSVHVADATREPVRGEDRQPLLLRRHEHDHHPRARLAAVLGVERQRGLVAVVAVGDQQLRVREVGELGAAPEAVAVAGEVGLTLRDRDPRPVVEQEDRLQLRPRRAQQAQAPFLRPRVRPLVRQHDPPLVRLEPQRDDEAVPLAHDAVRADVRLRERPRGRLRLADDDPARAPRRQVARRLLLRLRKGQVDDVVRAAVEVVEALFGRDHVVRRRDETLEPPRAVAIPLRAEGAYLGHGWTLT